MQVLSLMVGPDPSGTFVDATFGRGGHSRGILGALSSSGHLHGLDMDPQVGDEGAGDGSDLKKCIIKPAPVSSH